MTPQCQQAVAEVGNGIGASLRGVDCLANDMAQSAFGRLFGPEGSLSLPLTILLTLFIAFFAFALITGRSRIGIHSLVPRMVTLGLVLTLATSWIAYQNVVWNIAIGAPDEIASLLTGVKGSATHTFGDKIDVIFAAIQDATSQGGMQGDGGEGGAQQISTFSPPGLLWMGATLFLLGTVGVLVTARIALAVLMALGPIFIVLALFTGTRGLFAGWLRGLVMLAITPLFAVLAGTLMLEMAIPIMSSLSPTLGQIDPRAAMAFLMVGAVHVALMVLVLKTAGTMVGNWSVFGLISPRGDKGADSRPLPSPAPAQARTVQASGATGTPRHIAISGVTAGAPANDGSGFGGSGSAGRDTRIVSAAQATSTGATSSSPSRARGVGSRFRTASGAARLARSSEKMK